MREWDGMGWSDMVMLVLSCGMLRLLLLLGHGRRGGSG